MKKLLIIISLDILFPFTLLILLPSVFIRVRRGTSYNPVSQNLSFVSQKPVKFNFVSNLNNLQKLSLDLKNPNIKNHSQITFNITGANSETRKLIISGSNVGDPSTVAFKFPPFNDASGTNYSVSLSTTNNNPQELYILVDSHNQPVFNTYYFQSSFRTNLLRNITFQYHRILNQSIIHVFIYIITILILSLLILF